MFEEDTNVLAEALGVQSNDLIGPSEAVVGAVDDIGNNYDINSLDVVDVSVVAETSQICDGNEA